MTLQFDATIPVLRIFEVPMAREFYLNFLGMRWDWGHRFDAAAPVFAQVLRGGLVFFLSEHFGDGAPGTKLMLRVTGLDALHAELVARGYRHARPSIRTQPWGWRDMEVCDPFGNRLVFTQAMPEAG